MKRLLMIMMCLFAMLAAGTSLKAQEVTITLGPGWTWISIPSTETMDFATALGSFIPQTGDKIKSQWGNATYSANGGWRGNISEFYPGYGYKYYSTRQVPVTLTFNAQQTSSQVVVTTTEPMLITAVSAMGGGEVTTSDGTYIIVKGLCWATHENPTTNDDFYQEAESGVGTFSISMTGLNIATTYYVRAYAVTPNGTVYGDQKSFTTRDGIPEVSTAEVTNILGDGATCGGTVTDNGGLNVTARGVCWSTEHNPTLSDNHTTNGTGLGGFTSTMMGMDVSTTYYVRAYATTSQGTAYGEEVSFATRDGIPEVSTTEVTNIMTMVATCGGTVIDDGGLNVQRGVCWSISPNPTISDSHTTDGSGLGSFTSSITGLTSNTTYYVRAYASTSQTTVYGEEMSFTTLEIVVIDSISGIFCDMSSCYGSVNVDWPEARGVCWSTSQNPTVLDAHIVQEAEVGEPCSEEEPFYVNLIGDFSIQMKGLCPSTTYYVRAFIVNSASYNYSTHTYNYDCTYSNEITFTTPEERWTNGVLPGTFSVSSDQQVQFSQGNLQYKASTNTWRFAHSQWSYVGGFVTEDCYNVECGNVYNENGTKCHNNYISIMYPRIESMS